MDIASQGILIPSFPRKRESILKRNKKPLDSVVRFLHFKKAPIGMTEFERFIR